MSLLSVSGLTKKFGGLTAINNLTFYVEKGEFLGLIGPNGAGKTTLFNLISGFEKPTTGIIKFEDKIISGLPPYAIVKLGISRTFQIPKPFSNMTVLQNLMVAARYAGRLNKIQAKKEAIDILKNIGLEDKESWLAKDLTMIDLRKLELARALCNKPRLLLIDEVAAGLAHDEIPHMLEILKDIHDAGVTIILVEHVISVVMKIADRILVLHEGQKLAEGKPSEVARDSKVIEAYFGAAMFEKFNSTKLH